MNRFIKLCVLLLSFAGLLLGASNANAVACTAIASTAWNVQTTWGAAGTGCAGATGGIPGAADTVTVPTTFTVTVTAAAAATSLTVNGTGSVVNNSALTISGALGGTGGLTNSATGTLNLGGTSAITTLTATAVGNVVNYTGAAAQTIKATTYATLNFSGAGVKTNSGIVTVNTALTGTAMTNAATGTLNIGGTSTITTLTATAAGNVVNYTGAGQTVKATSYATLNVTGTATNSGTVTVATALGGAGTLTNAATGILNIGGTSLITGLTATAAGNVVNYTGAGQTVKATSYATLNVTGTATNSGTVTVATALGGAGTLTNAATGILNIGGTSTITTLTATAVGNVVNYTGAAAQTIKATTYATLNFSGAGVKTNTGIVTVNTALTGTALTNAATGTLNIGGTSTITTLTATAAGNVVNYTGAGQTVKATSYATLNVTGTATNSGTVTVATALGGAGTLTNAATGILNIGGTSLITGLTATAIGNIVNYTGAAAQTIKATTYATLNFSGAGVKTNTGIVTVNTALTGTALTNAATGTLNIGGTSTITTLTATAAGNIVNYTGAAVQTVKATAYSNLGLGGGGIKTITGVTVANNLTLSGTASATPPAAFTVGGNLDVGVGSTFTSANFTNSVTGTTTVSGTLAHSGVAAKTYVGAVTINAGGVWTNAGNAPVTFRGGLTHNGATFTAGTGIYTFNTTAAQSVNCAVALTIPSVTVTAPTVLTNNCNLTVSTALAGTGNLTNGATGTLNIGFAAVPAITTLTATAVGNTVNYNRAGAQAVRTTTYHHLGFGGTLAKTAAAGLTVNGDLTLSGTATFTAGAFTHNFAGNWIVNTTAAAPLSVVTTSLINFNTPAIPAPTSVGGTTVATLAFADVNINNTSGVTFNDNASFSTGTTPTLTVAAGATLTPAAAVIIISGTGTLTGSGTVQVTRTAAVANFASQYTITNKTLTNLTIDFAGVGTAQTVDVLTYGSATGGGLKVSNASGVNLTANTTVAGTLTLASGVVNAGAFTLISSGDCTTKVARTGGHVAGLLQLRFPTGAPSCTFYVGDATAYRPINASFASVTAAGNLVGSVSQAAGEHPNIATSGLDSTKDVNRYWTLTNPVGGTIAYTTYTATFNFINPTDFDAGATPANFEIERWDGAAWNVTTLGAATSTSTSASGLPSFVANSSNSFAVGEKIPPPTVVSINRADADPTSAATVSWTVTFSKSVTGVDATDFALAATGVSGTFITAVTGGGTTWTVTANTGIGSGTLGLNLVDDDTIIDAGGRKLGGTGAGNGNFTGQVYTITTTPALAEYRMDEANWNGTANEVVDSSGSGNHAQAFNSASTEDVSRAIPGSPGTCRNGVFDNGTTITQGYVQTPLPNLTTDFTVTAWIRTTNNTVAAQRILIDDQNNTGGYGISLGDAAGVLRFYSRGITPVILDSTYTIANNTWYFVAAVADITNKKRTIYVFDAAGALLNSTTEAAWTGGAWGTDGGPVSIGAETNASAEIPAANHFKGNLDEVSVYQKVLSQAALAAIATQTHTCPIYPLNHLEIQSSGIGLTCAASTLTIKACTDAAIPCAIPYTLGVSGTLSATGAPTVNWDGTTGGAAGAGFAIPNGGSLVTKDVQVATAGTVVFGITSPSPVPINATACNFGSPACTFTANTAGFIFSDTTTGNSYTIPAQVSGIATPTLYLRAVQASTTNPAVCTPAIVGQTTSVNMGYTCNNPAVCQPGNLATINATAIASGGTAVSLTFDANGSAPITARYDDVGEITLNANKTVTPFGGGTAITLNGNSNAFVVKPDHFDLSGIQRSSDAFANPAAVDATGAKFVKAGENFTVTVTAKNALGNTTPNYGQESTAESVKLNSALAAGLGLTNNPAIGGTFGVFTNGVATGTAFTWNEVGIIKLTPSVGDGDYLGAGDTSGTQTGNVGRFYAAKFALSGGAIANRTDIAACVASGCGSFTYMDERFDAQFTLTAQAVGGAPTQNYNYSATAANNFAKLNPTLAGNPLVFGAVDSTATPAYLTARLDTSLLATGNFVNGNGAANVVAPLAIGRGGAADGPYASLDIGIMPVDGDGALMAAYDLDTDAIAGNDHTKVARTEVRYGRIKLSNAHGSELLSLPITATVQFWNGGYVTSVTDSATQFNSNLSTAGGNVQAAIVKGPLALANVSVVTPGLVTFTNGVKTFKLGAPNVAGSVDLTIITAPSYLLPSTTGRATFGVYKGNNDFIYLRENY